MKRRWEALRGRGAFDRVIASGQRLEGTYLRCFFLVEPGGARPLRAGVAVSSRTYGAVRRNRIRRLIRSALTLEQEVLLGALGGRHSSVSLLLMFKSRKDVDVRRLRLPAVHEDLARLCRALKEKL